MDFLMKRPFKSINQETARQMWERSYQLRCFSEEEAGKEWFDDDDDGAR